MDRAGGTLADQPVRPEIVAAGVFVVFAQRPVDPVDAAGQGVLGERDVVGMGVGGQQGVAGPNDVAAAQFQRVDA